MTAGVDHPLDPVFKRCPRCEYQLRGLPPSHACPECGLRYDDRCELYRVRNPRTVVAVSAMAFAVGSINLKYLGDLPDLTSGVIIATIWILAACYGIFLLFQRHQRGFEVAVTTDGLLVRMPDLDDKVIEWERVAGAKVVDATESKSQVVRVTLHDKKKAMDIGGFENVFPTRTDADRFAQQVNERCETSTAPQ